MVNKSVVIACGIIIQCDSMMNNSDLDWLQILLLITCLDLQRTESDSKYWFETLIHVDNIH